MCGRVNESTLTVAFLLNVWVSHWFLHRHWTEQSEQCSSCWRQQISSSWFVVVSFVSSCFEATTSYPCGLSSLSDFGPIRTVPTWPPLSGLLTFSLSIFMLLPWRVEWYNGYELEISSFWVIFFFLYIATSLYGVFLNWFPCLALLFCPNGNHLVNIDLLSDLRVHSLLVRNAFDSHVSEQC